MTRISAIIPVRNDVRFLRTAVESVLAQKAGAFEVIVVDDGSEDGSISSISDLPVRILRQPWSGQAAAENYGIRESRGKYVTFLDSDDVMVPGALSCRADYLDAHPAEIAVGGHIKEIIDERGQSLTDAERVQAVLATAPTKLDLEYYRTGHFYPAWSCLYMYRKSVFNQFGSFDETYRIVFDCDLNYRILQITDIAIIPHPLFKRRVHNRNVSFDLSSQGKPQLRPAVVEEIQKLHANFGLPATDFTPWEMNLL